MKHRLSFIVLLSLLLIVGVWPLAAQDTTPVTIEHKFGSTTLETTPERIVSIGYTEHDAYYALGASPIAVRYWYGDENDAIFPLGR